MHTIVVDDVDVRNKRVLVREDFNVPLQNGVITNTKRLEAALPTIKLLQQRGANIILVSHLDRPQEGEFNPEFSLQPIANYLSQALQQEVSLITDWQAGVTLQPGQIVLLENIRFYVGENKDDDNLAQQLANLCDIFVMDAFATAHRAQASTHGVAKFAPIACAGPLLEAELTALSKALDNPKKPVVAIVGGAKVSTKLALLDSLSTIVDHLIVGGGIANTFLAAKDFPIGKSLVEVDLIPTAKKLLSKITIPLPVDVVTAKAFAADAPFAIKSVTEVADNDLILDIGPQTRAQFTELINKAHTILWNGPVGVFEFPQFSEGTAALAKAIAHSSAFSIAGGGDTLAAIDKFNIAKNISYISTGGGAFLEFIEGKTLPAVAILQQRAKEFHHA
ncbi:MAG: phosphoglycerate kinase [Legionellales bacterium]|nr:phosphoglycerate kinase [Legionellales bacterium]